MSKASKKETPPAEIWTDPPLTPFPDNPNGTQPRTTYPPGKKPKPNRGLNLGRVKCNSTAENPKIVICSFDLTEARFESMKRHGQIDATGVVSLLTVGIAAASIVLIAMLLISGWVGVKYSHGDFDDDHCGHGGGHGGKHGGSHGGGNQCGPKGAHKKKKKACGSKIGSSARSKSNKSGRKALSGVKGVPSSAIKGGNSSKKSKLSSKKKSSIKNAPSKK